MAIQRFTDVILGVAVGEAVADSETIPFGSFSAGQVFNPAASSIGTLTWYSSPDDKTYTPVYASGLPVITTLAAGRNELIPAACFACKHLRAIGDAAGTIAVTLKS